MPLPVMKSGARARATYERTPLDRLYRAEFYIWPEAIARWQKEGLPADWQEQNLFQYDPPGFIPTGINLGWCEAPFMPAYETRILRQEGDEEIVQDYAGRHIRVFKGRRHGFMPDYIKHPVNSMADWENDVAPRLDPLTPERFAELPDQVRKQRAEADAVQGILRQGMIGGYMYLRSLIGPEDLLYMVYDRPEVIHACMQGWFALMDRALALIQAEVELDEIFMAEDICYNHGLLVSPDHMREFLFPYYQQLLGNARRRQTRRIFYQVDTDGDCRPAIPVYMELGLDVMSPFEVASGCDVVAIARQYPNLILTGGIDKRILAEGKAAIDAHLKHILPFMVERGGYYPTCDHGVPDDVSFENYLHYRRRVCEMDHA